MTWLQIIVLAVIQGLSEFLPISSSGHLVLMPYVAGWADQGLAFDVAVHFGSLIAVCAFFRDDISGLLRGGIGLVTGRSTELERRMALGIGLGTIPAALAGLMFARWIELNLRDPMVVVVTLSFYGILMAAADRYGRRSRNITEIRMRDALLIGCAQALALIPGTSRSGVTITTGLALGMQRGDAARFSFLLSAPVILFASAYEFVLMLLSNEPIAWGQLAVAAAISAVVAYVSIDFFMRFVNRIGLMPFAIYRLLLAGLILYLLA